MNDPIGREIEGYRIDAEIGRGGRAVVHRATQLARQRTVALKVLPADAAERARIAREGTAAAGIDHPHVLPVYEVGEADGRVFIAMKLVDGPSLEELIRAPGGVEARRALAILRQVAEALDHVARLGTVHGDVRAGEVLIGPGDHAYLSGVGLGAAGRDDGAERLAPERAPGDPATAAADRYALAAVAMEALTGAPAFARADRAATREAHLRTEPPTASVRNPALGPAVDAVLARGLAEDAGARHPSAAAFVADLEGAVLATPGAAASRPVAASAAPRPEGAAPSPPPSPRPPPPPPPPAPAPAPQAAPPRAPAALAPRWRVPAIVLGVLAALVVVIGVVAATSGGGGARTVTELVLGTTSAAPSTSAPAAPSGFPLGAVLPAAIDGWELTATDPGLVDLELDREGDVEAARAVRGADVGLLAGLHPDGEDGRIAVERLRDELGGTSEGPVPLGPGITSEGILQSQGGVAAVSFGAPDRAIIAIAPTREGAIALAAAANEALGP